MEIILCYYANQPLELVLKDAVVQYVKKGIID